MLQSELLTYVAHILDANEIPYMVTGSVVSSYYGEPRASHDIDIVLELEARLALPFAQVFSLPQFHINPDTVRDAVARRSMFNLIDTTSGDKVDFWLLTFEAFDTARFARRRQVRLFGENVYVASPEDAILSKLRWAKLSGGSQKQLVDAVRIYEVQHGTLNVTYLEAWVNQLAVQAEWDQLLAQANPF